ncbi:PKD domain-containing protein [Flaviaesturariibacter amylovorans]|uniref:PKD domain-containing protein n=1 Tax=Flaviaesturariibacter amylovorans TaxID=1084520 RepID=A0ABP8G792_9BACT
MRQALQVTVLLLLSLSSFGQQKNAAKRKASAISSTQRTTDPGYTITPQNTSLCQGGIVTLTPSAPGVPNPVYQWTKDNANIATGTSATYVANETGQYSLIVTSGTTTIHYDTVSVTVNPNPTVSFTFTNDNTCAGTNVVFTATAAAGTAPFTYTWDFGNGATASGATVTKTFNPPFGCSFVDSTVSVKVTDAKGCIVTATRTVRIKQKPDVQVKDIQNLFNQFNNCNNSPSTVNPNFTVRIDNISPSASCITSYNVDWGDGNTQTGLTAASFPIPHTYTSLGQFPLVITAIGTNCNNSRTYNVVNQSNPAVGISAPGNTTGCAPTGFPFTLSNYNLNSPGTTYTWSFGDGSDDTVWTTPVTNAVINHIFDTTSCNSPGQQFIVKVTATNGCRSTNATVDNITIYKKPKARFNSPLSACVNSSVSFTNTSVPSYNQGSCNRETLYDWNFGDGGTSTQTSPSHAYTVPGTYTIRLIATGSCGNDTTTRQICIVGTPSSTFTADNLSGCAPLTANFTNTSTSLTACTPAGYSWSTSYSATNCGTGSSATFTNGTSPSSTNATLQFTNPGTYTVRLSVTNACATVNDTKTVVVKSKPSISFPSLSNGCAPFTQAPSATVTNCGSSPLTYAWTFTGGTPASSTDLNPGSVLYNSSGNYTVDLAATNECGTTTAARNFAVSLPPDLNVPAPVSACPGASVSGLTSSSATGGVTYAWTNSHTSIGLSGSGAGATLPTFTATNTTASPIVATITMKATSVTCVTTKTFTITVNPKPAKPAATTTVTLCQGATANPLSATASAGHSLVWYTVASGGTGSATAPTPATTATGTTAYYVSQKDDATGCESDRTKIDVTVNLTPGITTSSAVSPSSCGGNNGTITLNGLIAGQSYTVTYTKNSGTPIAATMTAVSGGVITITSLGAGTYSNITVTRNNCTSASVGPHTLSDPNPPATPVPTVASSPICSGATLQLSVPSAGAGATYSWTGPNGFSSSLREPSVTNASTAATGTYSLSITVAGCTSGTGTVNATVNQTPATPTVSAPDVCSGNTLSISASSSTAGVTYSWTGPNSFIANTADISIPNASTTDGGAYKVTVTLGACTSTATVTPTVNPTPSITAAANNPTSCGGANGSIVISGLSTGTYTITYKKNGSGQSLPNQSVTGSTFTIPNLNAATYSEIQVTRTGCPSNQVGPFTLSDPSAPAAPTAGANGPLCSGRDLELTASLVGNATYSWSGPNGFSSAIRNPVITTASTAATGTYSVTVTVAGCSSPAGTVDVTVNPTPATPTVSAPAVCSGNTLLLSASSSTAGVSWSWTGPNSFTSAVAAPSISNAATTASGSYTVRATLGSCFSEAGVTATVKPTPVISATAANPSSCASTTGSITISGLTAGTYNVFYEKNGAPVSLPGQTVTGSTFVITGLPAATYDRVRVSLDGCPSNEAGPFTLSDPNPPAAPTAGANGPICAGNDLLLTASNVTNATYTWSGPNGFSNNSQNPTIAGATTAASGTYSVTVTVAGCSSPAGTVTVTVSPTPAQPTITSNAPVCSGSTLTLNAGSSTPGVLTYAWEGPGGFTSTLQDLSFPNASAANGGIYTVTVTLGTCPSAPRSFTATVKPTPAITGTATSNPTTCNTATGSITLQGLTTPGTYTVSYTANGSPRVLTGQTPLAGGTLVLPNLAAGVYDAITVTLDGCPSNLVGPFTLSDPNPPATPVVSNSGPLCSGTNLSLTATSDAGVTYSWSGPNGFISNLQNPVLTGVPMAGAGTYSVTATLNGCTSAAGSTTVLVNLTPEVPVASSPAVCSGNTLSLTASSATPGVSYSWTGPAVFVSAQQNPTVPGATAANAGIYTVTATLGSCSSQGTTQAVVKPTPVIAGSFTNPTACNTPTGTLSVSGLDAGVYNVSYLYNGTPVTVTNVSPNGSGTITITTLNAGLYEAVRVSLDGCPSNEVGPFTLTDPNPPAAPAVSSNSPICFGSTLTLSANGVAGGTYAWSGPNSFASTLQNPSIANATTAATGTYTVTVTLNNCTSQPATLSAIVHPLPAAPAVTTPVVYCKDATPQALTATPDAGATLNWYTAATGGTASATAPVPSTATAGSTTYFVSQTSAAQCEGPRTAIEVVINPDADARFTFARDTACWPFVLDIQNTSTGSSNGSYNWYVDNVLIGTSTGAFPGYTIATPATAVTLKMVSVSAFGCKPDSTEHTFRTLPKAVAGFTASRTSGCGPLSVTFTNTTALIDTFRYQWNFGNGQFVNTAQPGTIVFPSAPTANDTVYTVVLKAFNECDTSVFQMNITVSSKPRALFTPDRTTGCSPMRVRFANTSLGHGNNYTWDFGDGTLVNSATRDAVEHVFHTAVVDTFYVKLIARNQCGTDTATYSIIVSPNPIQLFMAVNGTEANGCAPHTVNFINNTVGATGFQWDFGDGNTLSTTQGIDTVTHQYLNAGTYTVQLKAFNGCTDTTMLLTINVFAKPAAAFTASQNIVCIGDSIHFTNNTAGATSYLWKFGDGDVSTLTNPTHAYSTPGVYEVVLVAFRINGPGNVCTDSVRVPIQVRASMPGGITVSDSLTNCVPFTVSFSNPNGPAAVVTWDFGDGNSSTGNNVTHTYTRTGAFLARLTSIAPGGCTYEAQRLIRVNAPGGQLQYAGGFVCGPRTVRFDAANLVNTDTLIWNFGNGVTQTTLAAQPFIFYTYPAPGTFVPSVTLASTAGCRVPLAGLDTIKVDRLISGFTATQDRVCGSTTVTFRDTSNVFFGVREVKWNFGDNTTGTGGNVLHTYTTSGQYNIQQIVISNSGCSDTVYKVVDVVVHGIPQAGIAADALGCARINTTFTANVQSVDAIALYEWTVNGTIVSNSNPFVTNFTAAGTYNIRLIVRTVNGCADTALHAITVRPSPVVTATPPDAVLCRGNSVQLSAFGAGVTRYEWDPPQGLSCFTCPNPVASPTTTTRYMVAGYNASGCPGYDTVLVTVMQPFAMTVSANDSICIGDTSRLLASGATRYEWSPNISLSATNIANPLAWPANTVTYRVVGFDGADCFTDTAFVTVAVGRYPTVSLGPDLVLATGSRQPLNTVVVNGPIRDWAWSPATDLSCSNCPLPFATIRNDVTYSVMVTTPYGCSATDTLRIKAFCKETQVFMPNAFTPDGDGVNDVYFVQGSGIARVKTFRIFNRWGELVFEKNAVNANDVTAGWDGRIRGVPASPDVYVYTVEVLCENHTPYTYKGNVTLLK